MEKKIIVRVAQWVTTTQEMNQLRAYRAKKENLILLLMHRFHQCVKTVQRGGMVLIQGHLVAHHAQQVRGVVTKVQQILGHVNFVVLEHTVQK